MDELTKIEGTLGRIERRLEPRKPRSWVTEQTERVVDDLKTAPLIWALGAPALFSVLVAKGLSMGAASLSTTTITVLFLWFMCVYIGAPLVFAALLSMDLRGRRLLLPTGALILASGVLAALAVWSDVAAAAGAVILLAAVVWFVWTRRLYSREALEKAGWKRLTSQFAGNRAALDRIDRMHDVFVVVAALIGLAALIPIFAPFRPLPSLFEQTFSRINDVRSIGAAERSFERDRQVESLQFYTAGDPASRNVIACSLADSVPVLLRDAQSALAAADVPTPEGSVWGVAAGMNDRWRRLRHDRVPAAASDTSQRCLDRSSVRRYLESLTTFDGQLGLLHADLFEGQQRNLAEIYRRQRAIGLWVYAVALVYSFSIIVYVSWRRRQIPKNADTVDILSRRALARAGSNYRRIFATAIVFIYPLLAQIETERINAERPGSMFTQSNWYLPKTIVDRPPDRPPSTGTSARTDSLLAVLSQQLKDLPGRPGGQGALSATDSARLARIDSLIRIVDSTARVVARRVQ